LTAINRLDTVILVLKDLARHRDFTALLLLSLPKEDTREEKQGAADKLPESPSRKAFFESKTQDPGWEKGFPSPL
jgi:hypothetical protein